MANNKSIYQKVLSWQRLCWRRLCCDHLRLDSDKYELKEARFSVLFSFMSLLCLHPVVSINIYCTLNAWIDTGSSISFALLYLTMPRSSEACAYDRARIEYEVACLVDFAKMERSVARAEQSLEETRRLRAASKCSPSVIAPVFSQIVQNLHVA